jgi:hypothetical protein
MPRVLPSVADVICSAYLRNMVKITARCNPCPLFSIAVLKLSSRYNLGPLSRFSRVGVGNSTSRSHPTNKFPKRELRRFSVSAIRGIRSFPPTRFICFERSPRMLSTRSVRAFVMPLRTAKRSFPKGLLLAAFTSSATSRTAGTRTVTPLLKRSHSLWGCLSIGSASEFLRCGLR